jgi:hypothetical protein
MVIGHLKGECHPFIRLNVTVVRLVDQFDISHIAVRKYLDWLICQCNANGRVHS